MSRSETRQGEARRPETRVRLRKPLERIIGQGHPWVYRDAVERLDAEPGAIVTVLDRRGRFLARGWGDAGPIAVRLLTTRDEPIDRALIGRRVRQAAMLRSRVVPERTSAYRLLHGEGDRLPGVVVDVYAEHAVLRLDGAGAAAWRGPVVEALEPVLADRGVSALHERVGARGERRLITCFGTAPEGPLTVTERGMRLVVDLSRGQKTGLFLDHRDSRQRVREVSRGMRVLNLYGYTGGFSVAAGLGGATDVVTLDVAEPALRLARASWEANGLPAVLHRAEAADVPEWLARTGKGRATPWDLIVADPPSFAPNEASVERALSSYRRLHAACLALLSPGGLYLAASCSSHVDRAAFDDTLRDGASKAGRVAQVLGRWGAPADHPRLAAFPEGDYLKVTLLRTLD